MNHKIFSIVLFLILLISIGVGLDQSENFRQSIIHLQETLKNIDFKPEKKERSEEKATLIAGGDLVFHPIVYGTDNFIGKEPYHFDDIFAYIKPMVSEADYATITYESASVPSKPYLGFPLFNTPPEGLTAVKNAGFKAIATATNHCLDQGLEGLDLTLDEAKDVGLKYFGCKRGPEDSQLIEEINGIKVGFLNYSQLYNGLEANVPEAERYKISLFDVETIKKDIAQLKEQKVDIVIVYPHWGIEYQTVPSPEQVQQAHEIADAGADLILGSHPHVIQPSEWYEHGDKKTFIAYSLGNAVSNQRAAYLGTIDTEIGLFAKINLLKKNGVAEVENVTLMPSTVYVHPADGYLAYNICILKDMLEGPRNAELNENDRNHFMALQNRAEEIMAQPLPAV